MLHTRIMGYGQATSVYAYLYINISIMLRRSNQHCVSKHYQWSKETSRIFHFRKPWQIYKRLTATLIDIYTYSNCNIVRECYQSFIINNLSKKMSSDNSLRELFPSSERVAIGGWAPTQ